MKVISVYNIKGGVGKTTTMVNIAGALSLRGYKVLIVDNAPQANTTSNFDIYADDIPGILEIMIKEVDIEDAIIKTNISNIDILPSHIRYLTAEKVIAGDPGVLAEALEKVKENYDFCLIDNDPNLNIITTNALVACSHVLIPITVDKYAIDGITHLIDTITNIQDSYNPTLKILGMLITQFDVNIKAMGEFKKQLENKLGDLLFKTVIPRNDKVLDMTYLSSAKENIIIEDYTILADELCLRF